MGAARPHDQPVAGDDGLDAAAPEEVAHLLDRGGWLVRLRWIAIAGVVVTSGVAVWLRALADVRPVLGLAALMALTNGVLQVSWRRVGESTPLAFIQRAISLQLLLDLVMLTAMLHWSGSVENPFAMLFVFPLALGAILLPWRLALAVALAAMTMQGIALVAEAAGWIAYHPLTLGGLGARSGVPLLARSPAYAAGYLVAFSTTVLGVTWFVNTVATRLRRAEASRRAHQRVALTRERLARVGALAVGLAHTIRNPLHALLACVEILRGPAQDGDPDEDRTGPQAGSLQGDSGEILDLMMDGIDRIERVTARLLSLSRDQAPQMAPTDVGGLVRDAARLVEVRTRERGVRLHVELASAAPATLAADRVSEALVNLLENALYVCGADDEVTVRVRDDGGTPPAVRVEVEDTGGGIPADLLDRVFDPFFTTKPVGEGSGLGLAIARQVVEEHEGTIEVTSEEGRGTLVRMVLPYGEYSVTEEER